MKTLQNDFTTPEQSKRLLELGVPADSANCYFDSTKVGRPTIISLQIERDLVHTGQQYPCWSVGRLMEIYYICRCYDGYWDEIYRKETYIETYISAIEDAVLDEMLDFSKLEE